VVETTQLAELMCDCKYDFVITEEKLELIYTHQNTAGEDIACETYNLLQDTFH
jgi:hypothetical protein